MCFKMRMPSVQMPRVDQTGRDILPQSDSKVPDSPLFGDEDMEGLSFLDAAKRKGKESLKIPKPKTNEYNPRNF